MSDSPQISSNTNLTGLVTNQENRQDNAENFPKQEATDHDNPILQQQLQEGNPELQS